MKKQSKKRNLSFNKWMVITVLVIAAGAAFLWLFISQRLDSNRFTVADKNKDEVVNHMVAELGQPAALEEKNVCFNAEYGPYDSGTVWCQTATAIYYSNETDTARITAAYENAAKSVGIDSSDKAVKCELKVYEGRFATNPSYHFEGNDQSKQTIVVRCADRAKAKHYPYAE